MIRVHDPRPTSAKFTATFTFTVTVTVALLFSCLLASPACAQANEQAPELKIEGKPPVLSFRGPGTDRCMDVHPLKDGGFVVVGQTEVRGSFPPVTKGFVARYDKDGRRRLMFVLGDKGSTIAAAVDIDKKGRIVVAGTATHGVDFDPKGSSDMVATWTAAVKARKLNGFVVCYDTDGKFQWLTGIPAHSSQAMFLNLDASGPVHVAGTRPPAGGPPKRRTVPRLRGFLAQIDANGKQVWQKPLPFATMSMTADSSGGSFVAGSEIVIVEGRKMPRLHLRLVRFDSKGKELWSNRCETRGAGMNCIRGLACDRKGTLFLGGSLMGSVDLDPGPEKCELRSADDRHRMVVVARYAEKDGKLLNAFGFGRKSNASLTRLAIDGVGDVYAAGLGDRLDLDPGRGGKRAAKGDGEKEFGYFVAKYSPLGKLLWSHAGLVQSAMYSGSENMLRGLAVDKGLRVFAVGAFGCTLKLDGGREFENATRRDDGLVIRLDGLGKLK